MKKQLFTIIAVTLTIICLILAIVLIVFKSNKSKNNLDNDDINSKVISEVDFIDRNIIESMNKLNNITTARYKIYTKTINKPTNEVNNADTVSQTVTNNTLTETEDKNIKWDEVTNLYENIYSVWPTINVDLKKIGINEENLNKFNLDLNGLAQSINVKDKKSSMINLYNMYTQLPTFITSVCQDKFTIANYNTKSNVLNAYALASAGDKWQDVSTSVAKAKSNVESLMQSIEENDNRKVELEKTYNIINDLENSIVLNDKNIFFMNYKNTMQTLCQ